MTSYTLDRTNGPMLKFVGELIAETSGSVDDRGRGYAVTLFRTDDGYVVTIRFWPNKDAEPVVVAEFVEQTEDVEKVLYVFEPLEHLDQEYVEGLSADARQTLTAELFKLYDKEVGLALKAAGLLPANADPVPTNSKSRAV